MAGLEQQRNVGNRDACAGRQVREPLVDAPIDLGVDDGLEIGAGGAIGEHDAAERRAIERAVADGRPPDRNARSTRVRPGSARLDRVARQLVGVDRGRAEAAKRARQ